MQIIKVTEKILEEYKEKIIDLLFENLKTSLPFLNDMNALAFNEYNELRKYIENDLAILYGAIENEDLVGILWAYKKTFLNEPRVHIRDLIVDINYRRNGVGKLLESQLNRDLNEESIKTIELMATVENSGAIEFYKSAGYEVARVQLIKRLD